MSSIMASTILRTFSACASSDEAKSILLILVTPSTMCATCSPNSVLDLVDGDRGVFDGVVQQAGGDGRGVELHLGQDGGDLQRMHQVGLARLARLAFVMFEGEFVGLLDGGEIVGGAVGADLAQEIAKACDRQNIGRDLLAQSRHDRLYAKKFVECGARSGCKARFLDMDKSGAILCCRF